MAVFVLSGLDPIFILRVREHLRREDPRGALSRWARVTRRCVYQVAGPGSLLHIDGNHKLVRWNIVIHGAIDGYTRMIYYLYAADNNRAETVARLFTDAVKVHLTPP
jgi:hypothetical protein